MQENHKKIVIISTITLLIITTYIFSTLWILERKSAASIKAELKWIHVAQIDDITQLQAEIRKARYECLQVKKEL